MTTHKLSQTVTLLVLAALALWALAACTRSASSGAVPTQALATDAGIGPGGGGVETDPTMAALGTQVSAQMTGTAVAAGGEIGPGAGEAVTPPAPATTEALPTPLPTFTPTPLPTVAAGCSNPYTVKQGDWIYKIARDCQVEPRALIAANPGINPNYIQPGQTLNMPAAGATPSAACSGTYTVVTGDTLFRLAYNCGLTVEQLAALNSVPFPYLLQIGQVLRFP